MNNGQESKTVQTEPMSWAAGSRYPSSGAHKRSCYATQILADMEGK